MTKRKRFSGRSRGAANRAQNASKPAGRGAGGRAVWLFGIHSVTAALANPARNRHRLLATPETAGALAGADPAPEIMSRAEIGAVLPAGTVHQGLALLADDLAPVTLEELCRRGAEATRAVVVILDRVSDPHNVGAVLRSAAVFGATGVVVPERGAPDATGTLAKAASGALETVPLVQATNLARAMDILKNQGGFWCAGLDADGDTELGDAKLPDKLALVLGAEGAGLRRLTRERCDYLMRIPHAGALASLNVSNAAAVALWEFARRD